MSSQKQKMDRRGFIRVPPAAWLNESCADRVNEATSRCLVWNPGNFGGQILTGQIFAGMNSSGTGDASPARPGILTRPPRCWRLVTWRSARRGEKERPHGYGVYVINGAFTLWNMQQETSVVVSADHVGHSAGRDGAPVRGSGNFVSGGGDNAGRLNVRRLETGAVYSDGGIAPGTPDQITGGVFTVYGAHVDVVRNRGPVVTYGVNDMVLDNWGVVDRWTAEAKITSYGPSGIGFVNFGIVHELKVNAPIETFGQGARGFNVYTGTVNLAEFDRVTTHADGAVGIQISQPIGRLVVHRGIETFGGTGPSLVKGVVINLSAIALSIKPGGSAREIEISGGIKTNGAGVAPIEQHGAVESLRVTGGFIAAGGGFDKI
jgi:hypothetical protein